MPKWRRGASYQRRQGDLSIRQTLEYAVIGCGTFNDVVERTIAAVKNEGFGVLTDIDVSATMKAKLGVEFRPYGILGACNPPLAHQALQAEDKFGAMLPCNVIVQEKANGIEVSAVDPLAGMERIGNPELSGIASEVAGKLKKVMDSI